MAPPRAFRYSINSGLAPRPWATDSRSIAMLWGDAMGHLSDLLAVSSLFIVLKHVFRERFIYFTLLSVVLNTCLFVQNVGT